jgi:hypothetical protein
MEKSMIKNFEQINYIFHYKKKGIHVTLHQTKHSESIAKAM